VNPLVVV